MEHMDWRTSGNMPDKSSRDTLAEHRQNSTLERAGYGSAPNSAEKLVAQGIRSERGDAVFYEVQQVTAPPVLEKEYENDGAFNVWEKGAQKDPVSGFLSKTAKAVPLSTSPSAKKFRGYLWLLIFVAGLIGGTLFMNYAAAGQIGSGGAWMADTVDKMLDFHGDVGFFIHILMKRGGIFIFLAGMTLLCRRSLLLYLSTAYFGFCFGVAISSVTALSGAGGALRLLIFFLPHYMLYVPAYVLLLKWGQAAETARKNGQRAVGRSELAGAALFLALVVAGCALECWINPIWVRFFEKICSDLL